MIRPLSLVSVVASACLLLAAPLRAEDTPEKSAAGAHDAHQHAGHAHESMTGDAPVAGHSVYQLDTPWRDARGDTLELSSLRGHPVLVLLFYGTCESVCPVLVRDLQRIDEQIPAAQRADLRYLLISFDPTVDTPERLAAYAKAHGIDSKHWKLLHGTPDQVRELAAVLGVRYRATGNGQYSHTQRITLLDREGAVADHFDGVARPIEPIAQRVIEELGANDGHPEH